MTSKVTFTVLREDAVTSVNPRVMRISLPAPKGFALELATDRRETAPRTRPVTMDRLSHEDKQWLRGVERVRW